MFTFAAIFAVTIFCAAAVQFSISVWFSRRFQHSQVITLPAEHQQNATVLICIRGCDPSLRQSLIGILDQDFGNYSIQLVLDHRSDGAWDVVQEIKREHDLNDILSIHEMQTPLESCGLKCSALLQGLSAIDPQSKYLVLMDADVRPHSTWLSEMIGPLHNDPRIGLVTGNQWFEPPPKANWGSLVRSMWAAGALVPTAIFENPWAGTMAMRMEDVRKSDLPNVWQHSVVDDGPLRRVIAELGLQIHFAPSLIMINHEKCTFSYVNQWVTRMLTWSRIYEPTFFLSVVHAVFSNVVMLATFAFLLMGMLQSDWWVVGATAGALIISGILSVAAYAVVRNVVSYSASLRGQRLAPIGFVRVMKLFLAVAVVQVIYGRSCLRAIFLRQVRWRGITYQLKGSSGVKMIDYRPLAKTSEKVGSKVSI